MRDHARHLAAFVCLAGALTAGGASGAEASYLGKWTFVSAVRAPWADRAHPLDDAEPARLRGKTIILSPRSIAGPPPYLCRGPHYIRRDYPADMLFEGAFGEMRAKDNRSIRSCLPRRSAFTARVSRPSRPAATSTFILSTPTPPRWA